ncbi:MAG: alpha/beta hydrolase [Trueperaceae bacterium]|nr:alpha/beta hydrolase [Trueperaceae bacterium]
MRSVDVEGLRIAYRTQGEGPPLLLLHGGMADSRAWRREANALSDAYTVVAWDAPGCGQSSDPPASFGMDDYADCLAAFVEAVGLDRPHVLGLSFGGGLALALYGRHPAIPRSLLLVSAYAGWGGSLAPEEVRRRVAAFERAAEIPRARMAEEFVATLFSDVATPEALEETTRMVSEYHVAGARIMAHAFADADLRDVLPRVRVPTLLLYGDADVRSPAFVADELEAGIPTATRVTLPRVGHVVNIEAPERFEHEVRTFLRSHPG